MSRVLSMTNRIGVCLFSLACHAQFGVSVATLRPAGAPLDPSIRNEADHAARQAAVWLISRQTADGAWGTSNTVRLTSIALLALSATRAADTSDAQTRAALWLDAHGTNRIDDLQTHAWRLIALSRALPETPPRAALLTRYAARAAPLVAHAAPEARRLWAAACRAAALPHPPGNAETSDTPGLADERARLAQNWPPADTLRTEEAWQTARLINALPNGELMRGDTPLDWRRDLAQRLINAQRSDPAGGGYWDAPPGDSRIEETAFGLLTLAEL